ncbi:hypothetical protein ACOT81_05240 [Streptomyces sp. WI04-05B]|uniref:hypothetical protein n=1 Tax=Streptomyces TaxID=1883 RepID=UPI0029BCAA93|nr:MULTISPECIES: hypothetical protein [unclassified Streptomyces]MDX2546904.1 hypothetical protein [Streptomyces sp. WI04-05B]MDX2589289.1 hypothetical protein [Streptomyces sp. WI04-05A]
MGGAQASLLLAPLFEGIEFVDHDHREQQPDVLAAGKPEHLVQVDVCQLDGVTDVKTGVRDDEPLRAVPTADLRVEGRLGLLKRLDAFSEFEVHQAVDESFLGRASERPAVGEQNPVAAGENQGVDVLGADLGAQDTRRVRGPVEVPQEALVSVRLWKPEVEGVGVGLCK